MHAKGIVARVVGPCLLSLHAKQAAACQRVVVAVVLGAALSLSTIALGMRAATAYRHRIKCVDRLLGNEALHIARESIYAALAARWLTGLRQVLLVIDWSDLTPDQSWHWLRASVAVEEKNLGGQTTYRAFIGGRLVRSTRVPSMVAISSLNR